MLRTLTSSRPVFHFLLGAATTRQIATLHSSAQAAGYQIAVNWLPDDIISANDTPGSPEGPLSPIRRGSPNMIIALRILGIWRRGWPICPRTYCTVSGLDRFQCDAQLKTWRQYRLLRLATEEEKRAILHHCPDMAIPYARQAINVPTPAFFQFANSFIPDLTGGSIGLTLYAGHPQNAKTFLAQQESLHPLLIPPYNFNTPRSPDNATGLTPWVQLFLIGLATRLRPNEQINGLKNALGVTHWQDHVIRATALLYRRGLITKTRSYGKVWYGLSDTGYTFARTLTSQLLC